MLDKLAERAAKQQELNEENNKLKDQLKSYQDKLKCVLIIKNMYLIFKSTQVVSSNPADGEVYSIQNYVIKFVSELQQVGDFLRVLRFLPPIKLTAML